jgi:site-specific DNA-methyltransferase (adenine-specific)
MHNNIKINKIYNMDCLVGLKSIQGETIDLTVTSPPYDNLRDYNGYTFDFENIAKELYRVTKQGGVVVWVVGDATINGSETGTSFAQALYFMQIGFNLHDTMIYEKNSMSMPDINRYYQKFEYMFVFSKGKPKTFNPIKDHKNTAERWSKTFSIYNRDGSMQQKSRELEVSDYGVRFNIWKYNTGFSQGKTDNIKHPAIFPEELASDHIVSWSNPNDVVLDIFMGSGTTAKMALLNNRKFIGFEISEEYCNMANKRIEPLLNQVSIFEIIGE